MPIDVLEPKAAILRTTQEPKQETQQQQRRHEGTKARRYQSYLRLLLILDAVFRQPQLHHVGAHPAEQLPLMDLDAVSCSRHTRLREHAGHKKRNFGKQLIFT